MAKKISKQINNQFIPSYVGGYPVYAYGGKLYYSKGGRMQYGPGGFMMPTDLQNQGMANTAQGGGGSGFNQSLSKIPGIGGIIGMAGSVGESIGGAVGGDAGDIISGTFDPLSALKMYGQKGVSTKEKMLGTLIPGLGNMYAKNAAEEEAATNKQMALNKQNAMQNLPGQPNYIPTFGMGGKISPFELKMGTKVELAMGGRVDGYTGSTKNITDRISSFENGGLHSENGGIPVGQNSMVERDEYMFTNKKGEKYIFSNKF